MGWEMSVTMRQSARETAIQPFFLKKKLLDTDAIGRDKTRWRLADDEVSVTRRTEFCRNGGIGDWV